MSEETHEGRFSFLRPFEKNKRPQWFSFEVLERLELHAQGECRIVYEPGDCIIFMGEESDTGTTLHRPLVTVDLEHRGVIRARSPWTYKMDRSDLHWKNEKD